MRKRVLLLVVPPVDELDLVGPAEVFGTANRLLGGGRKPYAVEVVTTARDRRIDGEGGLSLLAHRRYHDLDDEQLEISLERDDRSCVIRTNRAPFQRTPFVAARLEDGRIARLFAAALEPSVWRVSLAGGRVGEIATAVTSPNGAVSIAALE